MNYLSVCSGIEAASVAWHSIGWKPLAFSDINPFASAVLKYRFPEVTNLGDMNEYERWNFERPVDLLVGGTPCQSFSIAGLRGGMADARGNLALVYARIAQKFNPKWIVWENVPGVLSSNKGRDFGSFVGALAECGYGWAYRVLDAQYFGVPQRRRRVFIVGYLGDWRRAAAVLFESEILCRSATTSKNKREEITATIKRGTRACSDGDKEELIISKTITTGMQKRLIDAELIVVHGSQDPCTNNSTAYTIGTNNGLETCVYQRNSTSVRRLTPVECERLQGFPDNWTLVPYNNKMAKDSPRYKAIGNSMAVPVMKWIGQRIQQWRTNEQVG